MRNILVLADSQPSRSVQEAHCPGRRPLAYYPATSPPTHPPKAVVVVFGAYLLVFAFLLSYTFPVDSRLGGE